MPFLRQKKDAQIPLDLGHRTAFGREHYYISESNEDAVGWIDRWPEWPAPTLILQGDAASGKSHLAAVWQNKAKAKRIKPQELMRENASEIFESKTPLLIDGLDPWLGDRDAETTLFHLYNMLKEDKSTMMVTMRMPPAQAIFTLPDLASRFRAAPVASIHAPDDQLLSSVLSKLLEDRQLQVGDDVIAYLLPRMERSFSAAHDIVDFADRRALSEKRNISVPFMRDVLCDMQEQ